MRLVWVVLYQHLVLGSTTYKKAMAEVGMHDVKRSGVWAAGVRSGTEYHGGVSRQTVEGEVLLLPLCRCLFDFLFDFQYRLVRSDQHFQAAFGGSMMHFHERGIICSRGKAIEGSTL